MFEGQHTGSAGAEPRSPSGNVADFCGSADGANALRRKFGARSISSWPHLDASTIETAIDLISSDEEDDSLEQKRSKVTKPIPSGYDRCVLVDLTNADDDDEEYSEMGAAPPKAVAARCAGRTPPFLRQNSDRLTGIATARMSDHSTDEEDSSDDEAAVRRRYRVRPDVTNSLASTGPEPCRLFYDERKPEAKRKRCKEDRNSNSGDDERFFSGNSVDAVSRTKKDGKASEEPSAPADKTGGHVIIELLDSDDDSDFEVKGIPKEIPSQQTKASKSKATMSEQVNNESCSARPLGYMRSKVAKPKQEMQSYSNGAVIPLRNSKKAKRRPVPWFQKSGAGRESTISTTAKGKNAESTFEHTAKQRDNHQVGKNPTAKLSPNNAFMRRSTDSGTTSDNRFSAAAANESSAALFTAAVSREELTQKSIFGAKVVTAGDLMEKTSQVQHPNESGKPGGGFSSNSGFQRRPTGSRTAIDSSMESESLSSDETYASSAAMLSSAVSSEEMAKKSTLGADLVAGDHLEDQRELQDWNDTRKPAGELSLNNESQLPPTCTRPSSKSLTSVETYPSSAAAFSSADSSGVLVQNGTLDATAGVGDFMNKRCETRNLDETESLFDAELSSPSESHLPNREKDTTPKSAGKDCATSRPLGCSGSSLSRKERQLATLIADSQKAHREIQRSSRPRKRVSYSYEDDLGLTDEQLYLMPSSKDDVDHGVTAPRRSSRQKQTLMRSEEKISDDDLQEREEDFHCMEAVHHLSRHFVDKGTGYPTHYFSVMNAEDETIYDFVAYVAKSGIPNAGLGAFLTFLGARVLNPESKRKASLRLAQRYPFEPETKKPLVAEAPGGFGVLVTLSRSTLHRNYGQDYLPETAIPRMARLPNGKDVTVYVTGKLLHFEDSDDEDEPLNPGRVGHLKMHTASDYQCDPDIQFSSKASGCGWVELGRYGPVLKEDRKTKIEYDVKNFIFSYESAEWGFGVSESLKRHRSLEQLIDITDDATGEPHKAARSLIPIHVNEVGNDKLRKQNVRSLEKNGRAIHYYLNLENPMAKGDTVELFTDYYSNYETVRERKNYGKRNIRDGLKGDDHEATALSRNFEERTDTVEMIMGLDYHETFLVLEFIVERILEPIVTLTKPYLAKSESEQVHIDALVRPSCLQWKALRRMSWLSIYFEKRVLQLLRNQHPFEIHGYPYRGLMKQCMEWARAMEWKSFDKFMQMRGLFSRAGMGDVHEAIDKELREEFLYALRLEVKLPLDERCWCQAARSMVKDLCFVTAHTSGKLRAKQYLEISKRTAATIRRSCERFRNDEDAASLICFESAFDRPMCTSASSLSALSSSTQSVWGHSTLAKNSAASLVDVLAYHDALEVGMLEEQFDTFYLETAVPERVILAHDSVLTRSDNAIGALAVPIDLKRLRNSLHKAHEDWYLLWQVVFLTHAFATQFLEKDDTNIYSLPDLCNFVGVSEESARYTIKMGMAEHPQIPTFTPGTSRRKLDKKSTKKASKTAKQKGASSPGGRKNVSKLIWNDLVWKTLLDLGWTLDVGTRPTDFYFLPPGVKRCRGFSNRKDYFDSQKLVLQFLQTDERWKNRPEILNCLRQAEKCTNLIADLKTKRRLPKGELKMEWLLSHIDGEL